MSKPLLYSTSLNEARLKGLWDSNLVTDLTGKILNSTTTRIEGPGQDWKELLRKFRKHNPSKEITALTATTEQSIHLLLLKAAKLGDYNPDTSHSFSIPSSTGKPKLVWSPLIVPTDRSIVENLLSKLESSIKNVGATVEEQNSAKIVRGWGFYSIGSFTEALEVLSRVDKSEKGGGESYDRTLRILAWATQGFCQERLNDTPAAISNYQTMSKLYQQASATTSKSISIEEMDRIAEEALFRLCYHSKSAIAKISSFPPHRSYLSLVPSPSSKSPFLFRPTKAILIHESMRKLLHDSKLVESSPQEWCEEVKRNNTAEELILRAFTTLPKASRINEPYLKFLDGIMEGWKISGAGTICAEENVKILYNALTHTFQSPRLLRYLIRLLTVLTRYIEAEKVLKLYVELFNKSRETDAGEVAKGLKKFAAQTNGNGHEKMIEEKEDAEEVEVDVDSDLEFISIALFGSRLLCRFLHQPAEGYKLAKRAREIFDEEKDAGIKNNKDVEGRIERSLGTALGALTSKDADLETRPTNHENSLAHLSNSINLLPNSWESHYALSYLLFELRQISPALTSAKKAVELNPSNSDCWHLLGLLVAVGKGLSGSGLGETLLVLETGIEEGEKGRIGNSFGREEIETDGEEEATRRNTKNNEIINGNDLPPPIDFSLPSLGAPLRSTSSSQFLESNESQASTSKIPIQSQINLPTDEMDKLISQIQLRMTKNVVVEIMEGPEPALLDQQGMMSFFVNSYSTIKQSESMKVAPVEIIVQDLSLQPTTSKLTRRLSFRSIRGESMLPTPSRSRVTSINSAYIQPVNGSDPSLNSMKSVVSTSESSPRAKKILVKLWLMSAASFRRGGRLEESKAAIAEAEKANADDEEVWAQFAQYCVAIGSTELARTSLVKALSFSLDHAPSIILLSRLYLSTPPVVPPPSHSTDPSNPSHILHSTTIPQNLKLPFAETLLDNLTRSSGWDLPEAWFDLSRCYKETGRREREKECLVWALQLEETRSIRGLKDCIQRNL